MLKSIRDLTKQSAQENAQFRTVMVVVFVFTAVIALLTFCLLRYLTIRDDNAAKERMSNYKALNDIQDMTHDNSLVNCKVNIKDVEARFKELEGSALFILGTEGDNFNTITNAERVFGLTFKKK